MNKIIEQLNELKAVQPSAEWKASNRSVLLTQISNAGVSDSFSIKFNRSFSKRVFKVISQPAWAFVLVVLFLGGVFSVRATSQTKPGDSLYIAKIVSKKAQLAITFNKDEKSKLGAKISNDVAKEITQVLSETSINDDAGKNKVVELTKNFKSEISNVKNRLQEIRVEPQVNNAINDNQTNNDDTEVFSANLEKDKNGLQVSGSKEDVVVEENKIEVPVVKSSDITSASTSKEGSVPVVVDNESAGSSVQANNILQEAEKLFDSQDYSGALNQLEKIDAIISGDKGGEVKGEATVSEGVVE